jgi:hypothetical protein
MNHYGINALEMTIAGEGFMSKNTSTRSGPSRDEIAALAYHLYEVNGRRDGRDLEHWLLAEAELKHHWA